MRRAACALAMQVVEAEELGEENIKRLLSRRPARPIKRKDRELVSLILQGPIVENPDDAQEVVGRKPKEERDRSGDEVMQTDAFGEQEQRPKSNRNARPPTNTYWTN